MPSEDSDPAAACPVDHRTREQWLQAAKAKGGNAHPPHPISTPLSPVSRWSLDTGTWESLPSTPPPKSQPKKPRLRSLSTDREISTIPRAAATEPSTLNSAEKAALPANSEKDTGHDTETGNWIYPSQEMFFKAMERKGHSANTQDMESIVPIHNAVNERCWKEIKDWEKGWGAERCGGPKLVSFAGDSKAITPKARWNSLLGYSLPFDRHDWVVERCGKKVDYVIDFYKGRDAMTPLSFYLDVRPKLNSWEGVKMRAARSLGL